MTQQEQDQKHLELALEMVRRQLSNLTLISGWDLHFTVLRALSNQFFCHQRILSSYVCTEIPGKKFLISANEHATAVFEPKIQIVA